MTRKRMQALRFSTDAHRRGRDAGRAAPALPRLRRRGLDRLGRAPLRPRRRARAGPAARADPRGLHDPQPAQGGAAAGRRSTSSRSGSRGCGSRRSWTRSGPTSTATRSWRCSGSPPGPVVGRAYRFLLELRLDRGPVDAATAEAELLAWWADQPESDAARPPPDPGAIPAGVTRRVPQARQRPGSRRREHDQPDRAAVRRRERRRQRDRGDERHVEQHVVQREDQAAVLVVDGPLHGRVHADLDAPGRRSRARRRRRPAAARGTAGPARPGPPR